MGSGTGVEVGVCWVERGGGEGVMVSVTRKAMRNGGFASGLGGLISFLNRLDVKY